ncbi:hypothetical protein EJB05_14797, partial [Eragrostis curvula]
MPPPPPSLVEELVEEILLRTPPDEPERFVHAALVCKAWCRLVSDPGFRRRFCERHRSRVPVLGVLRSISKRSDVMTTHFIPTCSFRPRRDALRRWRAIDCRHGRVLLLSERGESTSKRWYLALAVWDPITGNQRNLPWVPRTDGTWRAAVLCAAAAGECDHLYCHRGPFLVVVVGTHRDGMISAYAYSSESDAWSEPTFAQHQICLSEEGRAAHAGNALYFKCDYGHDHHNSGILAYDLATRKMTTIDPQPMSSWHTELLMTAEGGGLGSAVVRGSQLYLWSRETTGSHGDMRWMQKRVVDLKMLIPATRFKVKQVTSADDNGVVYVGTNRGCFFVDLKTGWLREVLGLNSTDNIIPYMSFYTPGTSYSAYLIRISTGANMS